MKNYLKADFYRIMTKKSRIRLMVLFGVAELIYMFICGYSAANAIAATNGIGKIDFVYFNIIMLFNILISFGDDFRARSIQAALGNGVKRYQIVLVKWISLILVAALDVTFLTALQFIPLILLQRLAGAYMIGQVLLSQFAVVFMIAAAVSLTLIALFQTQNALLGVIVYIYLTMDITSAIVFIAVSNKLVQRFQLWNIGAVNQMGTFFTKLSFGQFDFRNFIIVVFYFALGLGGTICLFQKKELDF